MARAVEVRVAGDVQGVSFRIYAVREASRLGIGGWIRNEPDGSVAGHFEGGDEAVADMVEWCWRGSPFAEVASVEVREVPASGASSFRVAY
jgi:acylphosphatase